MRSAVWFLVALVALAFDSLGASAQPGTSQTVRTFDSARTCAQCHETQYREWEGSMMHYSAQSPVFQAFEVTVRKLTGKFGPHDRQNPTFCINCHSPTASYGNEMIGLLRDEPSVNTMGQVAKEGIGCTTCHSVKKPADHDMPDKGLLGDSLANADFIFFPSSKVVGPTRTDPMPEPRGYHADGFWTQKKSSEYLTSSKFCGSCHGVNLPGKPDLVTGTPFQVEQDTFREWEASAYSKAENRFGKVVSCADCHMSLYGSRDPATGTVRGPGEFPTARVAKGYDRERRHALHRFTSASMSLVDDESTFPRQRTKDLDVFGVPMGQDALRRQMLNQACTLALRLPEKAALSTQGLSIEAVVTNTGAGHRVPTGLSQERELWIELTVTDDKGSILYSSGTLKDSGRSGEPKGDGRVDDEDLQDVVQSIDGRSMEVKTSALAADFNLRPFADGGTPKFSNAFLRKRGDADYEHVPFFAKADHVDNSRSLPVLDPVNVRYFLGPEVFGNRMPAECAKVRVTARLLYRSFRPSLLRALAKSEPALLGEKHVDRNEIVEMARAEQTLATCADKDPAASPVRNPGTVSVPSQTFEFSREDKSWIGFYQPRFWDAADAACRERKCALPTIAEYDSLDLAEYVPAPGDNHDELWKARWSSEIVDGYARTYTFGWKKDRVQMRRADDASLERLPFFCVCTAAEGAKR